MAIKKTDAINYQNIADAIRNVNGSDTLYLPSEMAATVSQLGRGGDCIAINSTGILQSFPTFKLPNGSFINPKHNYSFGQLRASESTDLTPDFSSFNTWRICVKFKKTENDSDVRYLLGSSKTGSPWRIPEILLDTVHNTIGVDLYDENSNPVSIRDVGEASGITPEYEWYYAVLSAKGTTIRLYIYSADGEEFDFGEATNFKIKENSNSSGIAIGGSRQGIGYFAYYTEIDLNELFIEGDGQLLWGLKNRITENLGVF